MTTQLIITLAVVAVAVCFALRTLIRTLRSRNTHCSCGCQSCPHSGNSTGCHCNHHLPDIEL